MKKAKYAVCFAGVPGSGKTPIANYLSWKFGLGIINSDQIRFETKEDFKVDNINVPEALAAFEKRLQERSDEVLGKGQPIIFDGSVDRRWSERKKQLQRYGYSWFLISMNPSEKFLLELFAATSRHQIVSLGQLPIYMGHHVDFQAKYSSDITLNISDDEFPRRMELATQGLQKFTDKL